MRNIVITGGTGLIGKYLARTFIKHGFSVTILSRAHKKSNITNLHFAQWDPGNAVIPQEVLKNAYAVVNLAGRNVGDKRWSADFKKEIVASRVESTNALVSFYNSYNGNKPAVFINASAIGYYGFDSQNLHVESDPPGKDFMAEVCIAWENAAKKLEAVPLVIFRIGIVLAKEGGALTELLRPVKLGAGAALGTGKQMFSWIHIDDLCNMIVYAVSNKQMAGVFNAVAPEPVTNGELIKAIAGKAGMPVILPNVPGFMLRLILGEFAEALTGSSNVSCEKIKSSGYIFKYPELKYALDDLLN